METIGAIAIATALFLGVFGYSCALDDRDEKEMQRLLEKLEQI